MIGVVCLELLMSAPVYQSPLTIPHHLSLSSITWCAKCSSQTACSFNIPWSSLMHNDVYVLNAFSLHLYLTKS